MAKKLIGTLLSLFTFYLVIGTYLDTGSIFWLYCNSLCSMGG